MEAIKRGYQENRRILIEGLPQAGLDQIPAGRRRVLSLCRRFGIHLRQFRVCRRDAGKGPCRGNPRHRLRSGAWPRVHPFFLCALGRRNARGGGAHRALARIARTRQTRSSRAFAAESIGAIDSADLIDFGCVESERPSAQRRADRSAKSNGGVKRHVGNDRNRSAGARGKALVQDSLCSGADRDPARRRGRLAVAQSCDQ